MRSRDYREMRKMMRGPDGPTGIVRTMIRFGETEGRIKMIPFVLSAFAAGAAAGAGVTAAVGHFKKKKDQKPDAEIEIETAEQVFTDDPEAAEAPEE